MPRKNRKPRKVEKSFPEKEMAYYEKHLPKRLHEPGDKRILVLDGTNIAYQAYYAYSSLIKYGKHVPVLFGVPQMLRPLIKSENPAKVVVCWDGKMSERRLKWLPEYKSHRRKDPDAKKRKKIIARGIKELKPMLYALGITQCYNEDIEGDDMVYLAVKRYSKLAPVTIISGDKDFNQLINWDVSVMNPLRKYSTTAWAFSTGPGVMIHQFVDYLCLVGDSSDDIPGIRGIGPARATRFLELHGSVKEYLKDKKASYTGMNDKKAVKKLYKRNKRMIDLTWYNERYNSTEGLKYFKDKRLPKFRLKRFIDICKTYHMKTLMNPQFYNVFKRLYEDA